jgi:hypothetical protein
MGIAAADLEEEPDVMYLAGVSCDGCHTKKRRTTLARVELFEKISDAGDCADCHADEGYGDLLDMWQGDVRSELEELKEKMEAVQTLAADCDLDTLAAEDAALGTEIKTLAERTRDDLAAVELDGSFGAHNYPYVISILDRLRGDLDQYETLLAKAGSVSPDIDSH